MLIFFRLIFKEERREMKCAKVKRNGDLPGDNDWYETAKMTGQSTSIHYFNEPLIMNHILHFYQLPDTRRVIKNGMAPWIYVT
ncbi:Serum paraoxonase/arylesterase [Dirofilaria immitis]